MEHHTEYSDSWQYTKAMMLSYVALVKTLSKSGIIAPTNVIEELDRYIFLAERSPDNVLMTGTMKLVRDCISDLGAETSITHTLAWFTNFIGNA
jgi:hypothetical protein